MALARTDLLGVISPAAGGNFGTGTFTSSSFTPPSSSLLFVTVGFTENGGGTNPAVDFAITDSGGHTWTQLYRQNTTGGFATGQLIFYTQIVTGASMTVSYTCAGRNISWWATSAFAYTGYDTVTPIGATATQIVNNFGAASPTPWSITLSGTPATTSEVVGVLTADKDTTGSTQGSTFTEIHDISNPTSSVGGGHETESRVGSASTTVDWVAVRPAGGNLFNFIVAGFEVRQATAGDVAVPDPVAGGGGTGGAPDGIALGTLSGGGSTAGTPDGLALGTVSGGSGSGGQPDGLALGVLADGGGTGGSPDGVVLGTVAGGAGTGGASDGLALGTLSGGAGTGGQADTLSGDTFIPDPVQRGAGTGGQADTVTSGSQVVHDQMVMPLAIKARTCLVTEVGKLANPPIKVQIRPGATFAALVDSTRDECCSGVAYVRTGNRVPTSGNWPSPLTGVDGPSASRGRAPYYAVNLELGIYRCLPTISNVPGSNDDFPTDDQWLQAAQDQADDGAALLRAVCCLQDEYGNDAVLAGTLTPLENQANCSGIMVNVQVRAPACDCVD